MHKNFLTSITSELIISSHRHLIKHLQVAMSHNHTTSQNIKSHLNN